MSINASLVTRDTDKLADTTNNVYMSVAIISKRSRQISAKMKEELSQKLAEFASTVDNLEEVFENREQIEISRFYERMPKPTAVSTEEFIGGKLNFRFAEVEEEKKDYL
jgi:DNA-directed RNA polymerase subunit K/omega